MPPEQLTPHRRFFISVAGSAATQILRVYPPADRLLDALSNLIASWFSAPKWLAYVILFATAAAIIYSFLYSRYGTRAYHGWRYMVRAVRFRLGLRPNLFSEQERDTEAFRHDMRHSIQSSRFMYALLVSGYTLVYEHEHFMLEALHSLPECQLAAKDIRFLFLDRSSQAWQRRAELFVRHRLAKKRFGIQEYTNHCVAAERELGGLGQVAFYNAEPRWRLYIFEDHIFISRYYDEPFHEAHFPIAAFEPDHPMYRWFSAEFTRLSPQDWRPHLAIPE